MAIHNGQNVLARRLRFFKRDPHCYWCGIRTVLGAEGEPYHATVDHLYSKMHPLRPTYYKSGHDRTAVLHVLACAECNQARAKADQLGYVFIPKLESHREIAKLASAVDGNEAVKLVKKVASIPTRSIIHEPTFGWTDNNGDLRPRSWEEYCKHRTAFVGPAFVRPKKPKRPTLCTIGELIQWRELNA